MKLVRKIRKSLTVNTLRLGFELARKGDEKTIERIRKILNGFMKAALPLRIMLKTNIKSTGLSPDDIVDPYFERAVDQMVMLANILQVGLPKSGCLEKFKFDDSLSILKNVYARGKGVICIAPHLSSYPLIGGIISSKIPCVIYLRHNKDSKKMDITKAIAESNNQEIIFPPNEGAKSQRLQVAIDALRQGKAMFLTSDTPKKPHEGVPVQIFGKTAHFPAGVFVMSLRTGAPVVPTWWYWKDDSYHIRFTEPIELERGGGLQAKAADAVQLWGKDVDAFLREHPDMWWNWLDKRWAKILRNGSLSK